MSSVNSCDTLSMVQTYEPELEAPAKPRAVGFETDVEANNASERSLESAMSSMIGEKTSRPGSVEHILEWDVVDDPANPRNWPFWERCYGTMIPSIACFVVFVCPF